MMTRMLLLLALAWSATAGAAAETASFQSARPVWPTGRETERNLLVGFRATVTAPAAEPAVLRLTASTLYRVFLNGTFVGHGPARAGHGFYRVDEWPLALRTGANVVAVEVAGYNVNSFYLLDQPSFLQAEVVAGDEVLAATGGAGFEATLLPERVQKVSRYSFQRPFSEVWRLAPGYDAWRQEPAAAFARTDCSVVAGKALLPRRVPYPTFTLRSPTAHVAAGTVQKGAMPKKPWKDRSLAKIGPTLEGYLEKDLETIPVLELQAVTTVSSGPATPEIALKPNTFHTVDFGVNLTGFIGATLNVRAKTRLFATFDEILTSNDVDFKRLGCVNIVLYELEPGRYHVESFEPYTLRYLKLIVLEGDCDVSDLSVREYVNPHAARAQFATSDERYNRIFAAARQTFQQNAVDVFMDCPSRERAGWLCDSFFTSRVARDLCGETTVEKNFYENFLLPAKFPYLPEGMLPMCYPSDHNDGVYIPNWALWFVVELEEYLERSGDRELVDALRPRVLRLLEFFKPYENADGLLEKLPSWVFVEWSKANSFVQDVNYPSNMLYARVLEAAARLYDLPDLAQKAARMRDTIRQQSFDGEFFVDNAVRKDGKLQVTRNRTEVCQYFAFFFGLATPQTQPKLWQALTTDFGPQRKLTKKYPEIHPANAFIGNQLRFELLSRDGRAQQVLDEALGYWLYMADRTGTLWEHDAPQASCNHGFASHAAHVFLRDVLGLYQVDPLHKTLQLRLADLPLEWCEGTLPTPAGDIRMRWWKDGAKIRYRLQTPDGYQVTVQNISGKELVKE
jgi:alpha-L-rhamnosidase